MDFANIKDPAGLKALLDSLAPVLASTSAVTNEHHDEPGASTAAEDEKNETNPLENLGDSSSSDSIQALSAAPESTVSNQVASLLSILERATTRHSNPPPPAPASSSSYILPPAPAPTAPIASSSSYNPLSASAPTFHPSLSSSTIHHAPNPRNMPFHQAIPLIGKILERPGAMTALRRMKIDQNALEQRLWVGREAIIAAQQKKVDDAILQSKLTNTTFPERERDNLRTQFKKELETYDTHRVLVAWDTLLTQQQTELEKMGFPTFFPTTTPSDRARQQRVIDVLSAALDPEPGDDGLN
ncbi:hypothetical protein DL93DRAFT_2097115 [Clavulina sp. PMI_390]|nr:hypothetical protein DL93DRAFT_2097115 [Clavulina sp. PMI_390]